MLQPENLVLAVLIVAGAYAWYRVGFRMADRFRTTCRSCLVAVMMASVVTLGGCASAGNEDSEPKCPPAKLPSLGGPLPRERAVKAPGELAIEAVAFHIAASSDADSLVLDPRVAEPVPGCPSPGPWEDSMTTRLRAAFRAGEASETHRAARAAGRSIVVDGVPARGQPGDTRISIETYAVGRAVQAGRNRYRVPVSIERRVEPHPPDDPFCKSVNEAVYLARPDTGKQWILILAAIGFPADGFCGT
jgi:hypothetical protein